MERRPIAATVKTSAENFTGDVYLTPIFNGDGTSRLVVGLVRFTPGARTNWHSHANGQLLQCTDGVGLVVTRDGTAIRLRAGDTVWTPAGEEHWHGGTAENMMCHYAILDETPAGDATTWLEPVTDQQYPRTSRPTRPPEQDEDTMAITETARRNHDELFPDRVSTLAQTDPELIERFDNFAFDEVLADSHLDIRTRLMVQLASLIACQAVSEFRVMAGAGLTIGLTPVELKEIVYQAVPYVGMAKVFDFLHAANDVLTERGVQLPLPGQSATTPATRLERGLATQKQIVGGERVDAMYRRRTRR